jgi:hypothetical protein
LYNQSTTDEGSFATDTYLTGSSISITNNSLQVGTRYNLVFDVSKTNAGVNAPIIQVRFGTNGNTSDTSLLTFTFNPQTADSDIGRWELNVTFRSVGGTTSAVLQGIAGVYHSLETTGLQNMPTKVVIAQSSGFDSTVSNSIIGVSVDAGMFANWTVSLVQARLENIT